MPRSGYIHDNLATSKELDLEPYEDDWLEILDMIESFYITELYTLKRVFGDRMSCLSDEADLRDPQSFTSEVKYNNWHKRIKGKASIAKRIFNAATTRILELQQKEKYNAKKTSNNSEEFDFKAGYTHLQKVLGERKALIKKLSDSLHQLREDVRKAGVGGLGESIEDKERISRFNAFYVLVAREFLPKWASSTISRIADGRLLEQEGRIKLLIEECNSKMEILNDNDEGETCANK